MYKRPYLRAEVMRCPSCDTLLFYKVFRKLGLVKIECCECKKYAKQISATSLSIAALNGLDYRLGQVTDIDT